MKAFKLFFLVTVLIFATQLSNAQIVSSQTGNWSDVATWTGGAVPTATDDVVITSGHDVSIDIANAECKNLTIAGRLYFALTTDNGITINGNTIVNGGARFRMASSTPNPAQYYQSIDFKGDLTVESTGVFDMRQTSSANGAVGRVIFSGSSNSSISLALTTYTSGSEEFNSVEINKTGGAKVILNSGNLFQSNNSSNFPDSLILTSGIIETGSNHWVLLKTGSEGIVGGSDDSYFNGIFARGVSNGGGLVESTFPVGEGTKYRPVTVSFNAPANATTHYVWVQMLSGNANTGSSAFFGGIDKVSELRYYEVGYLQNAGSATTMSAYKLSPTYSTDDGVNAGNTDLRVAYSSDNRAIWNDVGPSDHTTDLTTVPNTIASDSLSTDILISTGTSIFVSLAKATGTTTNSLPVELTSFLASVMGSSVELTWSTATELNNKGFEIERSVDNKTFVKVGFVGGSGTTSERRSYSFSNEVKISGDYSYRLKQIDQSGNYEYSNVINVTVEQPAAYSLAQNYPNPFNPSTTISYSIPTAGLVKIAIYNTLGEVIKELVNEIKEPGFYNINWNAANFNSGVYFLRIEANNFTSTQKMLLMK